MNVNMEDLLDNVLFNKPIKPINKPIKESEINVTEILGEDGTPSSEEIVNNALGGSGTENTPAVPAPSINDTPQEPNPLDQNAKQPVEPIPEIDEDSVEALIKRSRKIAEKHNPKGPLVLEIALQLEGKSCGKLQIGSEEYDTITSWKIIFDKFGIKPSIVPNSIKSFRIDAATKCSQTESDSVGISVELSGDGETLGIQVFYNEDGNIMDSLEQALSEFDRRYREYIITIINEKVRE